MNGTKMNRSTPPMVRVVSLLMVALTACSTYRPAYVWNDLGMQNPKNITRTSSSMQSWGATPEGPGAKDPMIVPGNLLTLSSLADGKLNGDFRVDFDGGLKLPYDSHVNTNGQTLSQLKKKVTDLYRPYFKTTPDLGLRLKERSCWVDVRGLVLKPGRYLVEPNDSLDQVVNMAGGTDKGNSPQFAKILKGEKFFIVDLNQYYAEGESRPQILGWIGGEVIFLQKEYTEAVSDQSSGSPYRMSIHLFGEVRNPGEYPLKPGSDFIDVLSQANGFTNEADLDHIEIIRRAKGRKRVYSFSWNQFERAPSPVQGDVILVHAVKQEKAELKVSIMGLIVSIILAGAIIYDINHDNSN